MTDRELLEIGFQRLKKVDSFRFGILYGTGKIPAEVKQLTGFWLDEEVLEELVEIGRNSNC